MDRFTEKDKKMADYIANSLHYLQVQHGVNFAEEVEWLKGLAERFGGDSTEDSDAIYYWDV